jgi:hypothetical protein
MWVAQTTDEICVSRIREKDEETDAQKSDVH